MLGDGATALFSGSAACVQGVQLFAGLEADSFAGGDADLSAGAGVAADAGFAGADAEDAEAAQLDALACRQGLLEALEDGVHGSLCLGARQACALNHVMNYILLDQSGHLSGATGFDCTTVYRIDGTEFALILELRPVEGWEFLLRDRRLPLAFLPAVRMGAGGQENVRLSSAGAFRKMNPSSGQRRQLVLAGRFLRPGAGEACRFRVTVGSGSKP